MTPPETSTVSAQAEPSDGLGQPCVVRNDYTSVDVPALGEWEPTLSVSVVLPAHGHQEKLDLVLAALSVQSYPSELLEVIVVDDGSPEPLQLGRVVPENVRLIRAADGAWGSAHAVNCGVEASTGDVVLRLDADMLVFREHVESQLRWHHQLDYAAVLGHKLFVDWEPERHTPEQVRDEVTAGRAGELFDASTADPHWIERNINKTNQLRTAGRLAYKVFIGATGSVHRSLFDRAGGLDPELVLGGDTEFAFRLYQQGAVFVPDLDTSSWHLGRTQMQTRREAGTRFRSPYVSNRVPDFHLRRKRPDRLWEVPYADVVVDVDGRTLEAVDTTVSALLDGTTPDLRMWLVGSWTELEDGRRSPLDEERLDLRLVQETFRGDPRVRFVESAPEPDPRVPFRLEAPAGAHPTRTAVADMVRVLDRKGAGLMCTPLPGATRAGGGLLRLERASSFARARHLDPDARGTDLDRVVEKAAGTHWTPGAEFVVDEGAGGEQAVAPGGGGPAGAAKDGGTGGGAKKRKKVQVERKDARREERRELERMNAEELRRELERARGETERLEARALRAERKLRWSTPGFGRRLLGRVLR